MRYVIVCLLENEILEFHKELVKDVCAKFNSKPQRLAAHFTIKAPFDTENIHEVEAIANDFALSKKKAKMKINGFDCFRNNVVFMKINPSSEALQLHQEFIDELKKISWLNWKQHEDETKIFHCTIVSRLNEQNFTSIWNYVNNFYPEFEFFFDNISILKWEKDRWVTYKSYKIK